MNLNSQRFPQFHAMVMLVAYVNYCFTMIRQNFLPVSFSSGVSWHSRTTACRFSNGRHFRRRDNDLCSRCVFM